MKEVLDELKDKIYKYDNDDDEIVSDSEFRKETLKYKHCPPISKESYYYRKVFEEFFGQNPSLIPHFWMPKWSNVQDPSARELDSYEED